MNVLYRYKGYTLFQWEELEDDNRKLERKIETPEEEVFFLDHSPYEEITFQGFMEYVQFHSRVGRMPTRMDLDGPFSGPLNEADLEVLNG